MPAPVAPRGPRPCRQSPRVTRQRGTTEARLQLCVPVPAGAGRSPSLRVCHHNEKCTCPAAGQRSTPVLVTCCGASSVPQTQLPRASRPEAASCFPGSEGPRPQPVPQGRWPAAAQVVRLGRVRRLEGSRTWWAVMPRPPGAPACGLSTRHGDLTHGWPSGPGERCRLPRTLTLHPGTPHPGCAVARLLAEAHGREGAAHRCGPGWVHHPQGERPARRAASEPRSLF